MQLTDDFTVAVPSDRLWDVLNDVEQIAPLVPGFTLAEANHPDYSGRMKIKVGAITVTYDATITFVERDEEHKRVVLSVKGRELRGAGSVTAKVTSSLVDHGAETTAEMVTDVNVTGRVAQFGRGMIADVSSRLTQQFVERLNAKLLLAASEEAAAANEPSAPPPPPSPASDDALDLGAAAAGPLLRRVLPVLAALGVLAIALYLVRRRSR